jgi:hypothetical protein
VCAGLTRRLAHTPPQSRRREQFRLARMDEEAVEAEAQRVYEVRAQRAHAHTHTQTHVGKAVRG